MRDWVAGDDLVHFVIEAVERLPLSTCAADLGETEAALADIPPPASVPPPPPWPI